VQSPVQKGAVASAPSGYRSFSYEPASGYYYTAPARRMNETGNGGFHAAGWKVRGL
jgi:hypothetical protein